MTCAVIAPRTLRELTLQKNVGISAEGHKWLQAAKTFLGICMLWIHAHCLRRYKTPLNHTPVILPKKVRLDPHIYIYIYIMGSMGYMFAIIK